MSKLTLLLVVAVVARATADIVFENEEIKLEEIFDLDYARTGNVSIGETSVTTSYYCTFRSNWNVANHPALYPALARWGNPLMYAHTKQYAPFIKKREAPSGVEQIAENLVSDVFKEQIVGAGELVGEPVEGKGFFIDQNKWDDNYVYLPPLKVTATHSFLSGIAAMSPSPDWYTAFYLFDTMKESTQTFWDSFKIRTYPWDAGTDDGTLYESQDRDTDPAGLVARIEVGSTAENIFLSPAGDKITYLAEWECILHTCPYDEPDCEKPDWPPANNCDVLRYPECNTPCDPLVEPDCEQCKRESNNEDKIYHKNCCLAGREPKDGTCDGEEESNDESTSSAASYQYIATATASIVFLMVSFLL